MGRLQALSRRPLVLASGSPQRKLLLRELGVPFEIVVSNVPEDEDAREKDPVKLVLTLARKKALAVARERPDAIVLGADTTVECRGRILAKPADAEEAFEMLRLLNGRWQRVYTGVALAADGGKTLRSAVAKSSVLARKLPEGELRRLARKHLDKAGGYAVQDKDDPFIARISGDYDNVVGLPMRLVRRLYSRLGCTLGSTK